LRLDERVPDAGTQRLAAVLAHDLRYRRRRDQVVDDRAARVLGQLPRGHQRGDRARGHRIAELVDDEAPVGVAVEGQADVRAVLLYRLLQVDEVLRLQRVRLVVGEGAVELEVHRDDRQRQRVELRV